MSSLPPSHYLGTLIGISYEYFVGVGVGAGSFLQFLSHTGFSDPITVRRVGFSSSVANSSCSRACREQICAQEKVPFFVRIVYALGGTRINETDIPVARR